MRLSDFFLLCYGMKKFILSDKRLLRVDYERQLMDKIDDGILNDETAIFLQQDGSTVRGIREIGLVLSHLYGFGALYDTVYNIRSHGSVYSKYADDLEKCWHGVGKWDVVTFDGCIHQTYRSGNDNRSPMNKTIGSD